MDDHHCNYITKLGKKNINNCLKIRIIFIFIFQESLLRLSKHCARIHGLKCKLNTMECGMNWVTFLILDFYHSLTTKKLENSKNKHVEEMFKNM